MSRRQKTCRKIIAILGTLMGWPFLTSMSHAQDTITNFISPVVSYQFYDTQVDMGTNSPIMSQVASYQYFDWPNPTEVQFLSSPPVSYLFNIGFGAVSVSVYGDVTDSSGAALSGATVSAAIFQIVQASCETAPDGSFKPEPSRQYAAC